MTEPAVSGLWNRPPFPVNTLPFDHVCVDGFLPRDLFDELASTFPECPPATGPTGFTIHPGDAGFDRLMSTHGAWSDLWKACDSQAFTDFMLRQFAACFSKDAVVSLDHARHVLRVESRAEKESRHPPANELAPDDLWVRFDLMQGRVGYKRKVHVDHRRRAATMLLYFTESEPSEADGGNLLLHGARGATATIVPRANRLVMFPCNNASWHSVSPIVRQRHPRNFLQVTLSSSVDLWRPLPQGFGARLREGFRALARGHVG
ncbi:2OG-Fe(II) oxygenase [Rhizobacter sp. OV335]|uniref:2OG-Fe(II) oxygenase family protein n=1 Tax=Rhizobacter sp. OV335 TaxID=1500264 RepID=UPI000910169D|nr:2OG-Fe(II) oxygenase [Rhizobacter sp. OV335]SHN08671.1 2OG-Fe(II) oxygenase superfamily protein [Rhizobacter sp. OV335]